MNGDKYKYSCKVIEIEGSYHKITMGHNAYDGFYDIQRICKGLINIVENHYNISLPDLENFYLQRIDIAKVFNLCEQKKVIDYINNLKLLSYPKRKIKHFLDERCIFCGTNYYFKNL